MRYRVFNKEKNAFETEEQLEKWFFMKPNGRLVVGASSCGEEMLDWMDREYIDKTYVVMYSTGVSDKNGIEIYEGDILDHEYNENCIVKFGEYDNGLSREDHSCGVGFYLSDSIRDNEIRGIFTSEWSHEYGVVGNINENPELLEEINRFDQPFKERSIKAAE